MRLIALLALLGCAVDYQDAMVRRGELNCELQDACGRADIYGGVNACKASARAQEYGECDGYDAGAMDACLEAYEGAIADAACDDATTTALGDACRVDLVCG